MINAFVVADTTWKCGGTAVELNVVTETTWKCGGTAVEMNVKKF
jgi:hypothetical protein